MSNSLKQVREQVMQRADREFHGDGREGKGPRGRSIPGSWRHRRASGDRAVPMGTESN